MSQHLEALQRANEVRLARADLKRAVKAGEVLVAEVLRGDIPDWLQRMPLEELCNAIPRFRHRHYERLCQQTHTGLTALVGKLTERQRSALSDGLAQWEASAVERRRARTRRSTRGTGRSPRRLAAP